MSGCISKAVGIKKTPLVLDLFAGAGGLSEGFVQAGCNVVSCIEMDKASCNTLRTRAIYHALKERNRLEEYRDYILGRVSRVDLIERFELQQARDSVIRAEITQGTHAGLIREIKRKLEGRKLDIIVGGPPCQAYSYIGRARDKQNMQGDKRNYLYKYYVEFLKELRPKVFIFENVPGLETAGGGHHLSHMRDVMKNAGYETGYDILNAADFGVPQNRKRIILLGWSEDSGIKAYPHFKGVDRSYLVKDFLTDLPPITAGDQVTFKKYAKANRLLEALGIIDPEFKILFDHITRRHNSRDLAIYRHAVALKNQGSNLRYDQLPAKLITHKNVKGFLDRFKVIDQNALGSHTVVAHISRDGNFYIHPDRRQNRSLSVREAARLQTFPDDYKFEGSRSSKFKQIGNAVPPMFAKTIARELCKHV